MPKTKPKKEREKLKALREAKGWSQMQLATKIGMSLGGYTNIEHGYRQGLMTTWILIAKTLGCAVDDILPPEFSKKMEA